MIHIKQIKETDDFVLLKLTVGDYSCQKYKKLVHGNHAES